MTIKIEYFSDVLCIWAYGGQIRMDELKRDFTDQVDIKYRFVPIFGAGKQHVCKVWKDKGELQGFNAHLQEVVKNWPHISISPSLWTGTAPQSSASAHLYLKAIQILAADSEIDDTAQTGFNGRTLFEQAIWLFRDTFFSEGKDIARRCVHDEIADMLGLPLPRIHELIDSGHAHAAIHADHEAARDYKVPGSPTLVLNEGRQLLYGNVGYRIIDANVRELLHNADHGEASWC